MIPGDGLVGPDWADARGLLEGTGFLAYAAFSAATVSILLFKS